MRKHLLKLASLLSVALAVALFAPQRAAADEDDPPSRVARLSYAHGTVSFNPAGTDDWVSAVVNRPITTGDKLWTDNGSRAELHIGSAAIRLSGNTGFSFLNLDDRTAQIRITEGTLNVRVRRLENDETFEIDTPNLAFSVLRPGSYKIDVNEAGDTTVVTVRDGEGEVTGGGSAYTIHARETGTFAGIDQLDADVQRFSPDEDDFDHWCYDRDRHADHSTSARYVSTDVIGYDDLDDYGGWRDAPEYGHVWFPHTTVVGWAPYRYGHWVWISPWGWTWVDDEPWGFAPFHYGRWVAVGGVWGWVPCPPRPVGVVYVRPVYAPALVAWVGGPHFSIGIGIGGGGGVGVAWFPLGPRDVYCPSYHVSERYVQNVNISNTTVINQANITNVYNNVYVNKTVNVTNITYQNQTAPNAVTATSHQAFTSAQPVARNMVKVDAREMASAPVAPLTPAVAPQQRSVLGAGASASVKPPAAVFARPVVAKVAPPPPPAPFVKQQQAIQANGGRPPAVSQIRQVQAENTQQARPNIKIAPPAQPGTPRNVQANRPAGNMQNAPANTQNNPGNVQNNQGNVQNNNNRPPSMNNSAPPNSANRPVNSPANSGNAPANSGNRPGNSPANSGNAPTNTGNSSKVYNDRPPSSRPNNSNNSYNVNPQLDQKHQQQLEQLHQKQDQERQKVEQKQIKEQQKIQQNNEDPRRQRVEQNQPPQRQQVEQQQVKEQQVKEQQQIQDRQRVAQQNADQQRQQQRQQQIDQKHEQQLQQLEQKHAQEQQKLQQQQQQERQKQQQQQQKPPKEDKKPPKDEKKPPQHG